MFCPKCGTQLDDSAVFCIKCGNKIGGETDAAEPVIEPEVVNQQSAGNTQEQIKYVPVEVKPGLADAIIVTIFCCIPFGVVGIVFAALSKGAIARGDYELAKRHARTARIFTWLGFGLGLVATLIYVLANIAAESL